MSWPAFGLLVLGAAALLVVELPQLRGRGSVVRLLARLVAVALILATAAGLTARVYFEGARRGGAAVEAGTEGVPVDTGGKGDDYGY